MKKTTSLPKVSSDELKVNIDEASEIIHFSLVIACYCDAPHLLENTMRIVAYLRRCRMNFEIIFVEDASPDNSAEAVRRTALELEELGIQNKSIFHKFNRGRGRCVSDGIRISEGEIVGFIDIDLEHRIDGLLAMIQRVEDGADVVAGHRIKQDPFNGLIRLIFSWVYRKLAHFLLPMSIIDTEAGIKVFNRKQILPILDQTIDERWFWDTEIIHRALKSNLVCENYPVIFKQDNSKLSTVKLLPDSVAYLKAIYSYRKLAR